MLEQHASFRLFVYFRVTTLQGGSIEPVKVPESLFKNALGNHGEMQRLVAEAAWHVLWQEQFDPYGNKLPEGEHMRMLKQLCKKLGRKTVHEAFVNHIIYERVEHGSD